jgi:hypothetical protein
MGFDQDEHHNISEQHLNNFEVSDMGESWIYYFHHEIILKTPECRKGWTLGFGDSRPYKHQA